MSLSTGKLVIRWPYFDSYDDPGYCARHQDANQSVKVLAWLVLSIPEWWTWSGLTGTSMRLSCTSDLPAPRPSPLLWKVLLPPLLPRLLLPAAVSYKFFSKLMIELSVYDYVTNWIIPQLLLLSWRPPEDSLGHLWVLRRSPLLRRLY